MSLPSPPESALEAQDSQTRRSLGRITAALARIEAAMAKKTAPAPDLSAAHTELRQRHGALRIATAGALAQLDTLITALGKGEAGDTGEP